MFPVNLTFKIGVKKLYTSFIGSSSFELKDNFALGLGMGSILPISNSVYSNPELWFQSYIDKTNLNYLSLAMNFGYSFNPKFHLSFGPSILWNYKENQDNFDKPFLMLYNHQINKNNKIMLGARLSLKYLGTINFICYSINKSYLSTIDFICYSINKTNLHP